LRGFAVLSVLEAAPENSISNPKKAIFRQPPAVQCELGIAKLYIRIAKPSIPKGRIRR